jgi:hypothetical protein
VAAGAFAKKKYGAAARRIKPLKTSGRAQFLFPVAPRRQPWALRSTGPKEACDMYQSLFPRDVFAELERLQREMREAFDLSPNIRASAGADFPR